MPLLASSSPAHGVLRHAPRKITVIPEIEPLRLALGFLDLRGAAANHDKECIRTLPAQDIEAVEQEINPLISLERAGIEHERLISGQLGENRCNGKKRQRRSEAGPDRTGSSR